MSNKTFQELHLGIFKPDDSYKNCLKRVRNEPCGKIAEELHYAHKRNEAKDKSIAELMARIAKAELAFAVVEGRIAELEKANDTLHKLMISGEKRGVDKATQEFKLSRKELIEEFAEAECMGDLAKIARNYGYEEQDK